MMKDLEKIFKALADRNRLRILNMLAQRRMCVCEMAFVLSIKQPSVSRHLKKLKRAGLISSEQDGYWTNYFLIKGSKDYSGSLLRHLSTWIKKDIIFQKDIRKSKKADRKKLCCHS